MSDDELKPCPFCGAIQEEKKIPASGASSDCYFSKGLAKRMWNTRK